MGEADDFRSPPELSVPHIEPEGPEAHEAVFLPVSFVFHLRKISEISQNSLGISPPAIATLLSHRAGNCKKIAGYPAIGKEGMWFAGQSVLPTLNRERFTEGRKKVCVLL